MFLCSLTADVSMYDVMWHDIFVWTLCAGMCETEMCSEEIVANPTQQQVHTGSFKYQISPGRGHHLRYECVWRMRGTTWGVGRNGGGGGSVGWTCWDTAPHFSTTLSPLIRTVSHLDNIENGESATSASVWVSASLQCLTLIPQCKSPRLLLPWTLWMKVCKAQWCGSAVA